MFKYLVLLLSFPLFAQTLPNAPIPQRDYVKPIALVFGVQERIHTTPYIPAIMRNDGIQTEVMISFGATYRFRKDQDVVGLFLGYTPETQTQSLFLNFSTKLFEFGRVR